MDIFFIGCLENGNTDHILEVQVHFTVNKLSYSIFNFPVSMGNQIFPLVSKSSGSFTSQRETSPTLYWRNPISFKVIVVTQK